MSASSRTQYAKYRSHITRSGGTTLGLLKGAAAHVGRRPRVAHNGTYALPVTAPRYVHPMSCVEVPESVKRLLVELSHGREMPANVLDHHAVALAADNGWVYQHQGLVGLTGAGAYHAGKGRRGGMLG